MRNKIFNYRNTKRTSAKKELRRYEYESDNYSVSSDEEYEDEDIQTRQCFSEERNNLEKPLDTINANSTSDTKVNNLKVDEKDANERDSQSTSTMTNSRSRSCNKVDAKANKSIKLKSKKRKTAGERSRVIQGKPRLTKKPPLVHYDTNRNNNNWFGIHKFYENETSRLENERFLMCCVM